MNPRVNMTFSTKDMCNRTYFSTFPNDTLWRVTLSVWIKAEDFPLPTCIIPVFIYIFRGIESNSDWLKPNQMVAFTDTTVHILCSAGSLHFVCCYHGTS